LANILGVEGTGSHAQEIALPARVLNVDPNHCTTRKHARHSVAAMGQAEGDRRRRVRCEARRLAGTFTDLPTRRRTTEHLAQRMAKQDTAQQELSASLRPKKRIVAIPLADMQ
jgi:hypothetical protein